MRRTIAVAVSMLLFAWGAYSFHARVRKVEPHIGVEWIDLSRGVVAEAVIPREPGWKGGLRPGDHLQAVDGTPVSRAREAEKALRRVPPDGNITFQVERAGRLVDLRVRPVRVGGRTPVDYYLALVALTFLGVGLVVWLRATRARAAVPFALHCQAMFLYLIHSWTGRGGILDWSAYWGDLAGLLLAPALFVHINWALTDEDHGTGRWRVSRALFYAPALILFVYNLYLIPFEGVFRSEDPVGTIRVKERLEQLYVAVFLIAGIVKAVRSYLNAERLQTRWQLKWMAWGSVFGFLPAALFYLGPLSLDIRMGTWSELSVLPMALVPLTFAAAIVHYRLLDLDIFLKRITVAIGLLLCAAATYAACYVIMDRAAGSNAPLGLNLALILSTFLMAIFYPRLHRRLKTFVDQFFYRERYDYRRTLVEFGEALNRELSLPTLIRKFTGRVERTFGLRNAHVFVRRADGRELVSESRGAGLHLDDPVVRLLNGIDYLPLRDHPGVSRTETGSLLIESFELEYLLPLTVEGEMVAVLGVGETHGGQPLTTEDLQLLVSLCCHAAVAFEGARLYSELAEKVREVQTLKEFNESILESSRVGILVADPDGSIVGLNRAFEILYGAGRESLLGRSIGDLVPAGVFAASGGNGRPSGDLNLPDEGLRVFRTSLSTPDGRRLVVNLTQSALRGADGEPRGRVVTVDDVTEQVQREEELQRREHLTSIGLLASGIAHEVNTPLTGIASYAQILLEGRPSDDPEYGTLKKIEQQAFRAAGIAASLLNFSRQRDGDYQALEIGGVLEETLQLFQPHIRGRRIALRQKIDSPLPRVRGNRGRLQQVLMNLLLNAADAMPEGGTVSVLASTGSGLVQIEVSDTGMGILPDVLERIYDPFFTTKPHGEGTGLGLSVSYGIVKEHAGTLTAESNPGKGARFIMSLPAYEAGERRVPA